MKNGYRIFLFTSILAVFFAVTVTPLFAGPNTESNCTLNIYPEALPRGQEFTFEVVYYPDPVPYRRTETVEFFWPNDSEDPDCDGYSEYTMRKRTWYDKDKDKIAGGSVTFESVPLDPCVDGTGYAVLKVTFHGSKACTAVTTFEVVEPTPP